MWLTSPYLKICIMYAKFLSPDRRGTYWLVLGCGDQMNFKLLSPRQKSFMRNSFNVSADCRITLGVDHRPPQSLSMPCTNVSAPGCLILKGYLLQTVQWKGYDLLCDSLQLLRSFWWYIHSLCMYVADTISLHVYANFLSPNRRVFLSFIFISQTLSIEAVLSWFCVISCDVLVSLQIWLRHGLCLCHYFQRGHLQLAVCTAAVNFNYCWLPQYDEAGSCSMHYIWWANLYTCTHYWILIKL